MEEFKSSRQRRLVLTSQCNANPLLQIVEYARCKNSVVRFCNDWCFTYDPRLKDGLRDIPFDLFAVQADFLLWLEERRHLAEHTQIKAGGVVPKSRERGATWLCCVYATHQWLFSDSVSIGFGSLKLEEVDQIGNMNTILEKIRYLLRKLPHWMKPKGYDEAKHARHGKILNPFNKSAIVGEGGEDLGRGGKTTMFFLDEASHVKDDQAVNSALSANTNCRIDVSTYRGAGGDFYQKCYGGNYTLFNPSDPKIHQFSKFVLHWADDPRTSPEWAEAIRKEIGPTNWAEQYDMDPHASLEDICIPAAWVQAAVDLELLDFCGECGAARQKLGEKCESCGQLVPRLSDSIVCGLDCSGEGDNRTVLTPRSGPYVKMPVSWSGLGTTPSAWRASTEADDMGAKEMFYDSSGLGIGYKSAWESAEKQPAVKLTPINTGLPPTETKWPNGKMSKELFMNQRAEYWWMVRTRFEKAFEFKNNLADHPADEMISIPRHTQLILELSSPRIERRETGKLCMEAKKTMRSRGVASPDFADSLVLSFVPRPRKKKAVFW